MDRKTMIQQALDRARHVTESGMGKEASAVSSEDEVTKLADALEFIALQASNDGTAAGAVRQQMVEGFLAKTAAPGGPAVSESATGRQPDLPHQGKKTIQPGGKPSAANPENSEAPTGEMSRHVMEQKAPGTASTPTESGKGKVAESQTLFDVLMQTQKAAGAYGGPAESDAEMDSAAPPKKNENSNISLLRSNTAPVEATKREAKAPTRRRLAEIWESAGDTQSDAVAGKVWPQSAAKGEIKVAFLARAFREEREEQGKVAESEKQAGPTKKKWNDPTRVKPSYFHEALDSDVAASAEASENRDKALKKAREGHYGGKKLLRRAGIGAAIGAPIGAGAAAFSGDSGLKGLAQGGLIGGVGGGAMGALNHQNRAAQISEQADREHAERKGLSTKKIPRTGLGRILGKTKTTYHMSEEAQKRHGYK